MKRISAMVFAAVLVLSLLCGCDLLSGDIEQQLVLPPVTGPTMKISQQLRSEISDDVTLVYADRGRHQNPVGFTDINGDGVDETVISYRSASAYPDSPDAVHLRIYIRSGEELNAVFDIEGLGSGLDMYDFGDLDGDGAPELVAGYILSNDNSRVFCIYSLDFETGTVEPVLTKTYTDWVMTDMDGNGVSDIVYIYSDVLHRNSYIRLVKYNSISRGIKEYFGLYDRLAYSSGMSRLTSARATDGTNCIIVSYAQSAMLMSNEVFSWDKSSGMIVNHAVAATGEVGSVVSGLSDRFCTLGRYLPSDIDGDGITEIPMCYTFSEETVAWNLSQSRDRLLYRYTWYAFSGKDGQLQKKYVGYINDALNYIFLVSDERLYDYMRVYRDSENNLEFYYYDRIAYMKYYEEYQAELEKNPDAAMGMNIPKKMTLLFTVRAAEQPGDSGFVIGRNADSYFILEVEPGLSEELLEYVPKSDILSDCLICTSIISGDESK